MYPVVIPAAGYGTRSLPASKTIPKEMLTLFDRPIIQWVVEEAVNAGLKDIIFVTSKGKSSIEDHFDIQPELENILRKPGKESFLKVVSEVSRMVSVQSVRQKEALGLGHAVLMAKNLVSTSHFGVMLGDDLCEAKVPGIQQLVKKYETLKSQVPDAGVVLLMRVADSEVSKYGICEVEDEVSLKVRRCVEKPSPSQTKSRLAIIGRYFLPTSVFGILEKSVSGTLGEIQLTDGLNQLAQNGKLYGCLLDGRRFDAGDRVGFMEASVYYALQSSYGTQVREVLKEMVK